MEPTSDVAIDAAVTANDCCDMSCEVENDEVRFQFEDADTGLELAFDWRGFIRFMQVTSTVIERLRAIPDGASISLIITANADDNGDIIAALRMTSDQGSRWSPTAWPSRPKSAARSDTTEARHSPANLSAYPYVTVKGNGALTCEILPDQIEFRFGDDNSGLHLFLNYRGFAKLMTVAHNVIKRLQSISDSTCINFKVSNNEEPNDITRHSRRRSEARRNG